MAYKIMKKLIQDGNRSKQELTNKADVFFAVGRLTEEQYMDIIKQIEQRGNN